MSLSSIKGIQMPHSAQIFFVHTPNCLSYNMQRLWFWRQSKCHQARHHDTERHHDGRGTISRELKMGGVDCIPLDIYDTIWKKIWQVTCGTSTYEPAELVSVELPVETHRSADRIFETLEGVKRTCRNLLIIFDQHLTSCTQRVKTIVSLCVEQCRGVLAK